IPSLRNDSFESHTLDDLQHVGGCSREFLEQSKLGAGLDDLCQVSASLRERVAGEIASVQLQHIEGVEDDSMPRMQASVLQSLKRWATGLVNRDNLSVDDCLLGSDPPSCGYNGRVHAGQALLVPRLNRHVISVLHQERPIP